jgi:hypothetical protein
MVSVSQSQSVITNKNILVAAFGCVMDLNKLRLCTRIDNLLPSRIRASELSSFYGHYASLAFTVMVPPSATAVPFTVIVVANSETV